MIKIKMVKRYWFSQNIWFNFYNNALWNLYDSWLKTQDMCYVMLWHVCLSHWQDPIFTSLEQLRNLHMISTAYDLLSQDLEYYMYFEPCIIYNDWHAHKSQWMDV